MLTKPLDQNRYRMLNIQLEQFDSRASRAVVEFRSTAYCLLLTAYCLPLTAYRLPLTAYCLLLTAYRPPPPITSHLSQQRWTLPTSFLRTSFIGRSTLGRIYPATGYLRSAS